MPNVTLKPIVVVIVVGSSSCCCCAGCGSSPKQESKVLFPGALPLASAGVGGYISIYMVQRWPPPPPPPMGMGLQYPLVLLVPPPVACGGPPLWTVLVVCIYLSIYLSMYVCKYVCMYVSKYVCMYVDVRRCPYHCRPDIIKTSMMISMQHVQMGIYSMHAYMHTYIHTYIHHTSTGGIIPPPSHGGGGNTGHGTIYIYTYGISHYL